MKLPAVALAALLFAGLPLASSSAYVGISVAIAPPAIPVYEQPLCPAPGYIWTPGYWAYADFGYYWVPGVWVAPPRVGLLWTPGYWGYRGGRYLFNEGYWGPAVGFYGGINYGFGYGGRGYYGGEWAGDTFRYNTAVTRVNTTVIHNTYVNNKVVNNTGSRASFNGQGGATAKPTAQEQTAAKAEHVPPTSTQKSRVEAAKNDPALHAKNNNGKPKPEAIKALDGNNREQPTAAAGGTAGAEKQTGAKKQAGVTKATANAAKATDHSHPAGTAGQTEAAAASHTGKAAQTKHNGQTRNAGALHSKQPAQAAAHRSQGVKTHQPPATHGPGSAPASQNAKKKKQPKEQPDGGH